MQKSDSRVLYDMKLTTGMSYIYGPDGKKAHEEAIEYDKDKSYRLVVNIVGKVAQGKTSLRRLLIGEDFNENEQSTVGIEHELVETLGTTPNPGNFWSKVDLQMANVDECNIIVGKHVRKRLENSQRQKKHKAEIQSFLKATLLSYFMLFLYFTASESEVSLCPWFSVMLIVSLAFSGLLLFGSLRDGFGMTLGVLCLVLYNDCLLRWKSYELFEHLEYNVCLMWSVVYAFLYFARIHMVMAFSMGISTGLGFCFVLCLMQPPWTREILSHNVFKDPHLHIFTMCVLIGIWTLRHPEIIAATFTILALISPFISKAFIFSVLSGLGCGYSHVIFIKLGFDTYVKLLNKVLKSVSESRRNRRFICYFLGIIPGIFITIVLEWKLSKQWFVHAIFGTFVIIFIEVCHSFLEGKVEANPKASISNATKVLDSKSEASLKFVIRDFAGHPLYHSVHHIYMMGHCVYLIVFSATEAKRNFKYCFAEILYWLQAIFVHDRFPSVRAFIIGTHRDDKSLSRDDIDMVSEKILNHLPRQFHNMVVWNRLTDRPVFYVENSIRNPKDDDHLYLRQQLLDLAKDSMKPEYPIKYLYFYRVINDCRLRGRLIETLETIEQLCCEHECSVTADGELEDLLNYFHESGEIIYNSYDNNQNQLVVLDPKALVDIMTSLVRAPPRADRQAEYMLAWNTVVDLGIATRKLLHHIIEKSPLVSEEINVDIVIGLLEYLDLVCKLDLGIDGRNVTGEKCYLLIPLVKDTLPYPQNYWDDISSDTILYFDFGPVVPKFIFTRLVCQCTSETHVDVGMNGSYHLNVCTSKALFTFRSGFRQSNSFKIELLDIKESATPTQQLLKIVIRGSEQESCMELTKRLCQKICNIVDRDFRKCRYKIGVMCPFEGPHEFCQNEHHIFSLYESIKPEGYHRVLRIDLPDNKEFWCRGRQFSFRHGQIIVSPIQNAHHQLERQRSGLWDVNILDLPPRLFSDICDDLNIFNALGRDWRLLAETLGKSKRQIELLKMRSPRDPCDALLQDWAASTTEATVERLVEKLTRMERFDVVRRLEDYIQGS
ncbi:uncharacterized protein [Mytilus edulis]|uniref:uncharacterized protein n=1 Tax=Mytilus edulis TaxID=6550 RepID=UPI0039F0D624